MSLRSRIGDAEPHIHAGLRNKSPVSIYTRDLIAASGTTPTLVESPSAWSEIGVTRFRFLPQTPCVHVFQDPLELITGTVRFRVKGYNRWGEHVVETTPWGTFTAVDNNFLYLASVFNLITKLEYQLDGGGSLGPSAMISFGVFPNFARTEDATNHYVWGDNMGIGLPMRVSQIPRQRATYDSDPLTELTAEVPEFQVLNLDIFNRTSGQLWRVGDNLIVGRNVAGFAREHHKVTIANFATLTTEAGAAAAQAATDALQIGVTLHTMLTRISGRTLNHVPRVH